MTAVIRFPSSVEGTAVGTARVIVRGGRGPESRTLDEAFEAERNRLGALTEDGAASDIFAAHLEMLDDPLLRESIENHISEGMTDLKAVEASSDEIASMLSGSGDEYLAARADDVRDVCRGLADSLCGGPSDPFADLPDEAVIVAEELFPSDTARMDFGKVRAFVTARGSVTSHVSIIARGRGIPAVLGADVSPIKDGDLLLVDGDNSEVRINPSGEEVAGFRRRTGRRNFFPEETRRMLKEAGVRIYANAGSIEDVRAAIKCGVEGIGLFRTEFLFLEGASLPDEEEQYRIYREVVEACEGKPVTIRTMDIGGDKAVPGLDLPEEDNPFLGMRAIRISLARPDLFKAQVRAILRASAHGKVRMMLPMVARVDELTAAKGIVADCMDELEASGTAFDKSVEVGIMVETPAAVFIADSLAAEADFFSIGTNDLTQYIMAVDRGNASVSYLYDPLDPAVRFAVRMVAEAARKAGIPVGVCGEATADPRAVEYFCEVGVDSLSLTSPSKVLFKDESGRQ